MFHGWGKTKRYFEGWYFKLVDAEEKNVLAIIPGISIEKDGRSHCFIQILDGINQKAEYLEFDANQFIPDKNDFTISLGSNTFSGSGLTLDHPKIQGNIKFNGSTQWPKMLKAPGIMGWYSFVPFMECYHGIVSLHHTLSGSIIYNGKKIDFNKGIGYNEKDWGISFPECWIWIHSNHFDKNRKISLFASVAKIPWLGSHFIGFIAGFYLDGTLYKFATYTGAKLTALTTESHVEIHYKDPKKHLKIVAHKAPGTDLRSPIIGRMTGKVNESIQAIHQVWLWEKDQLIYEGTGRNGGLELAGDIEQLLTE
jgi:hypothetical protein